MSGRISTPLLDAALARAVELGERSVQVAAHADGELLVNAWIGDADEHTVFPIFSTSKAVTALAVHLQAERRRLDLDAPIARYWPEYGARGKERVTARQVLAHRAGVPQMPPQITPERLGDWDWVVAALAELEPMFEPGTRNAYHSMSFGWLLGEVVRRTDPLERPFARFVADELCAPLGVESFWFGIPAEVEPRVARLRLPEPAPGAPPAAALAAVPAQVALAPAVFNRSDVHAAAVPAVGAIADARSVARLFAPFACAGRPLLSADRVHAMLTPRPQYDVADATYGRLLPVGIGGLWIEAPGVVPAGHEGGVLGHPGAGGTVSWAEPGSGLSVSILHDRMFAAADPHPFTAIADAVRAALAESRR